MMEQLPIQLLILDVDIQSRAQIDVVVVQEYADLMRDGICFPAIDVIRENDNNYVWDGFHRVLAAKQAEIQTLWANVKRGTKTNAQWLASGTNKDHGLRRTNADKRRAVEMALRANHEMSDREIAKHCGVDHKTVAPIRSELESSGEFPQTTQRTVTRNGTTYTQNTANIGKRTLPNTIVTITDKSIEMASTRGTGEYIRVPQSKPKSHPVFNRTNENIEWAAWSWNPVTGCKHGCPYCYARDIANRFYSWGFTPTFHVERLSAPMNTKQIGPRWEGDQGYNGVFVCSMADLFGKWVPDKWIDNVLEVVSTMSQWTYIFLTKNPSRYIDFEFPSNAWLGATVDEQSRVAPTVKAMSKIDANKKFLSCEPMRERLVFPSLDMFDWVIIGGQSKTTKCPEFQPEIEWVVELTNRAGVDKTYWKTNLTCRPRNYGTMFSEPT